MNPIKRIREEHGLTQEQLADLAGITQQGILRYEQSLYENPSPKVVDALLDLQEPGSDPGSPKARNVIIDAYKANRHQIQLSAARFFTYSHPITSHGWEHPFITWRTKSINDPSRMRFCILLAVHPSTVAEYEKGKRRYLPNQLRQALITAGVGNDTLERLDYAGAIWHDSVVKGKIGAH